MANEQRNYLINDPAQGYRAVINGCQDAILVAPTGDIIATFTHMDDAMHTAEVLNTQRENTDSLAVAATMIERIIDDAVRCGPPHFVAYGARQRLQAALEAINAAPGRKVIKAGSGVGK